MARKQYKGFSSSHEKKKTKKERKVELDQARANFVPQEEIIPTEEETVQVKNLVLYSVIGIGLLLILMYWIFTKNL